MVVALRPAATRTAPRRAAALTAALALLGLAACGRTPPAPAARAAATAAAPIAAHADHEQDRRYRIDIVYPELPAGSEPLAAALRAYADQARRAFMQTLEGGAAPDADIPWQLKLEFGVAAHTADFIGVRARGGSYTGGAHALPLVASFNYDVRERRVLALGDLFADPAAALRLLAAHARRALGERAAHAAPDGSAPRPEAGDASLQRALAWIDEGTEPRPANYAVFLIHADPAGRADGLVLLFPPYQAGPYALGTQEVQVPAAAFAALLKPRYREAFATGPAP
ncbi:hypothetical protein MBSD_n1521 [Mizugakiibacter sediminis]|uniref:DUF3298 domain-containing protein n=1 Tax=Mizugakiibacter sediminis TaxID=1475481 RepID=A0A0K8QMY3_9GAMM|nr:hypothetical protein MBSD_n1521 [Mizugakiibacter sediminis]